MCTVSGDEQSESCSWCTSWPFERLNPFVMVDYNTSSNESNDNPSLTPRNANVLFRFIHDLDQLQEESKCRKCRSIIQFCLGASFASYYVCDL
jgi:hypothetical protein